MGIGSSGMRWENLLRDWAQTISSTYIITGEAYYPIASACSCYKMRLDLLVRQGFRQKGNHDGIIHNNNDWRRLQSR